jgi:predicted permease
MRRLRRFLKRLTSWATRERDEERLRAEIEEHLAMQAEENVRLGLSPDEARRQAVWKFGSPQATRESYRDAKGLPLLESLARETHYALRSLRNTPAFAVTTTLTLALGIGATTSIFTLVHAVLLSSLPVANPGELYRVGKEARCCYWGGYSQTSEFSLFSYDLYKHFREHIKGFAELAAFSASEQLYGVRGRGAAEGSRSFPGEFVSGNYFAMFGIRAFAGRTITPSDDEPNAPPVAMMSHRLWQQEYGSDPSVIGRVVNLSKKPFTIIGITPPGFYGDTLRENPPDFFLPLEAESYDGDGDLNTVDLHWLDLIGRIRPSASPTSIEAEMRVQLKNWLHSHWGKMSANDRALFPQQTLFLRPGGAGITSLREQYEQWLKILMTVSSFVLLIVCANIANLMLVRGMERRRQISLSMALGASPGRVMRQPLTESVVLSLVGGTAGLAVAFWGTRLILHFAFPTVSGLPGVPISPIPSGPVLLFAFSVSLATGVLFGIAPAFIATRVDPIEALRGANRSTSRTSSFSRKTLVIFQACLSLVLLSVSGLLTATLQRLEHRDFGFEQERRMVVKIDPRLAGYPGAKLTPLYRRVHDAIANIPGVASVALCIYSPESGNNWGSGAWIDGRPAPGPSEDNLVSFDRVTPGYFEVIGNPIVRGRPISELDTATSRHIAVINQAFARRYFRNENPLGKYFGRSELRMSHQYEIVGVAKDARYLTSGLEKPIGPFFFLPEAQHDFVQKDHLTDADPGSHYLKDIVILSRPGAHVSDSLVRRALASVDSSVPIISIQTLQQQVSAVFGQQRLIARLTSFFGLLSLVLSCIGLYGVTAYNAERRTGEIGLRMALGAGRKQVVGLVVRGAFALISLGIVTGLPLAFIAGRFLGSELYGTDPYNPVVFVMAVTALALSAMLAALAPALRATFISPIEALRAE